ncbi:SulP family inorganic anion transporter [Paracoccus sulfuroxidans]|uniref:SulP family sulfate permease n=1 Tax=Paracoccus sulfuroxidans TaxID=384678 RepID=A0A562P112_9RHOB|nr:sulfate permease [Paracoccus sulfuroxidans]TWI38168.1 SulP family sulfate permease [Paracoccus sulfuroxidans]
MSLRPAQRWRAFRSHPERLFPILDWGRRYDLPTFSADLLAAVIVTIMLIPQSLAYALLAGMPAQTGLYASTLPLILYAVLGTSRTLAVGPVAVISLMTAAAVGEVVQSGAATHVEAAVILAFMSGLMLLAMGCVKLGFLSAFLSHPVIAGFITASGILIAGSQIKTILGIPGKGQTLPEIALSIWEGLPAIQPVTTGIGIGAIAYLYLSRTRLSGFLKARGIGGHLAQIITRISPVVAIAVTTLISWGFDLGAKGVPVVGAIPAGLPAPSWPLMDASVWTQLALPALMMSIVGYVETVSVAQTLAARRRERIDPDQEMIALGASNIGAAVAGGFPVTGGFARSVVNFDAGARTPAAGAFTALGMMLATLTLTGLLYHLPQATLAATIIIAVLSLVDLRALPRTWHYSPGDGASMLVTILATLLLGVETGIITGVVLSLALHLYRSSRPHVAVLGQVPGTEHFRNIDRHDVVTAPDVLSLRFDESLYFPNARFLEDTIYDRVAAEPRIRHVVLNCAAVNAIDSSALEALEAVNSQLSDAGVKLHLSEVKGPVMDHLRRSHLLENLTGKVFLTQVDAMRALSPDLTHQTCARARCETARDHRGRIG